MKSDFENSKAYHYQEDLRNQTVWSLTFLTPVHVIKDSNLENLVKSSQILNIPKPITIYMTSLTVLKGHIIREYRDSLLLVRYLFIN